MSGLVEDLREHVLGPETCAQCGQQRTDKWRYLCKEEGQCDWNRDYGTHTDGGIDVFKAKVDILLAADEITRLTTRVAELEKALSDIQAGAEAAAYGRYHTICYNCADTAETAKQALEKL